MAVVYEWLVEELDGPGDDAEIIDPHHCETLAEARSLAAYYEFTRIGLVRDQGNDIEGLTDRQWAYLDVDGKLPERMDWGGGEDGGALVPKRFHKETEA